MPAALFDDAHRVAFRGGRLARPVIVPASRVGTVTRDDIVEFRNKHFVGEKITVAAYGRPAISHHSAVTLPPLCVAHLRILLRLSM